MTADVRGCAKPVNAVVRVADRGNVSRKPLIICSLFVPISRIAVE
jgi:hypothetical protein